MSPVAVGSSLRARIGIQEITDVKGGAQVVLKYVLEAVAEADSYHCLGLHLRLREVRSPQPLLSGLLVTMMVLCKQCCGICCDMINCFYYIGMACR